VVLDLAAYMQSYIPCVRIQSILPALLTVAGLATCPVGAQTSSPPTAIVVAKTITMNSSAIVDSFDSSDPLKSTNYFYDPTKRQSNGNIFVANNIGSDLHNAFVYGDLRYSGTAVKNCANVQGMVATPYTAITSAVSDPTWSDGSFVQYTGGGNPPGSAFVANGTASNPTLIKVVGDFTVPGGRTFGVVNSTVVDRYLTVWVTGKFTTSGSGRIVQDQYAHVTWIVDKDITVSGDNYQNNSLQAGNVSFLAVGPGKVNISGAASLLALISAPSRDLNISGTGGLTGSVVSSTLSLAGGTAVHFDEAFASSGAFRLSFEGQPPGTAYGVDQYVEHEIQFTGQPSLAHNGGGLSGFPDDGTGYLQSSYKMAFLDLRGRLLKLKAVDLAEYSYVYAYPTSITFVGSKVDGATVSQTFTTDGLLGVAGVADFQTFTFGDEWADLVRIDVQSAFPFSIDNVALER
jgi:hypothetical protein